jgi:hypothetical protein
VPDDGEDREPDTPHEPGIADLTKPLPLDWPGPEAPVHFGTDPRVFPMGFGSRGGVMLPWDSPQDVLERRDYYAFRPHSLDPYAEAPWTEAAGGVVYFDAEDTEQSDIEAMLRLLEVQRLSTKYGVFLREAEEPLREGFLVELRIYTTNALDRIAPGTRDSAEEQPVTVGDLIWRFITEQQERWGLGYSWELSGTFGGDGDWAKEALAFGFLVENQDLGIYRLWSRAWLVTK